MQTGEYKMDYKELIRDMPSIPQYKKTAMDMGGAFMNVIFKKIADDLAAINKSLEEYKHPIIKIPEFPQDLEVRLSDSDINKLSQSKKDLFPKSVSVSNLKDMSVNVDLSQVASAISDLKNHLNSLKSGDVRVSNLADLVIPAQEIKIDTKEFARLDMIPELIREIRSIAENIGNTASAVSIAPTAGNVVRATGVSGVKALTDGTAVALVASSTEITRVDITVTNGPVAVGFDDTVSATSGSENGVILYPGNQPHTLYIRNLNVVYVAGANGRRVCYNYYA